MSRRVGWGDVWCHRSDERLLLLLAAVATCGAGAVVLFARDGGFLPADPWSYKPLAVFVATFFAAHATLLLTRSLCDPFVLPMSALLSGMGVLAHMRLAPWPAVPGFLPADAHLPLAVLAAMAVYLAARGGRHAGLQAAAWPAWLAAMAVLAVLAVFGQRFRGGVFLPGGANPVELAKPLLLLFAAGFLATHRKAFTGAAFGVPLESPGVTLRLLFACGGIAALLLYLRDLGLLVLLCVVLLALLHALTRRPLLLALGALTTVGLLVCAYWLSPHSRARMLVWWDPFTDPTGRGWQVLQALSALYTGGMFGRGLGGGSPEAVPIASTDFVYAILGEEIGFLGCGVVLFAFLALVRRCFRIGSEAAGEHARLLATGVGILLAVQTLLNVGGVIKWIPLTGIPLPFISTGGSSLLATFACLGLVLAVSEDRPLAIPRGARRGPAKPRAPRGPRVSRPHRDGT